MLITADRFFHTSPSSEQVKASESKSSLTEPEKSQKASFVARWMVIDDKLTCKWYKVNR